MIVLSLFLWSLTFVSVGIGILCGFIATIRYQTPHSPDKAALLMWIAVSFFALAGIMATAASKFEAEGK